VVPDDRDAAEIARIALSGESLPTGVAPTQREAPRADEMSYQDWRTEVLGLVSIEF
jgi:hypothetical protein